VWLGGATVRTSDYQRHQTWLETKTSNDKKLIIKLYNLSKVKVKLGYIIVRSKA